MDTHESDTNQGQQKVVLKRKLTGPPRLLLGKAKTVNHTGERSDARALRHQRRMDGNGTAKHSSPTTTQDALREEDASLTLPPENLQATVEKDTEGSCHARLQNDSTTCDAGSEEDTVKEQHCDVSSRKSKKTTKEGIRRLFPHVFMCVKRRRDKQGFGDLKIKRGNAMTPQTMECTGEDTQSTDETISPGGTCTSNTDAEFETGNKSEKKKRIKTAWIPFVGRHAHKSRCLTKDSQMTVTPKDVKALQKKTLRKRIQGFLTRQKKAVSSNQFESDVTQTPEPERVERQVDSHLDNNEDQGLSRLHQQDIQETDGEDQAGCPDTMTVSAEVTAPSAKGSECEPSEGDTGEILCMMSEDVTSKEDGNVLESCADAQESSELNLNDSPGLSEGVTTVTCVVLDSDFRPHIDIAMTTDEVFQNGSDDIQFDNMTTGPDRDNLVPYKNPGNMSFLTVPVDGCWSLCEANSTDVKPCSNAHDRSLPPEGTSPHDDESLLVLTANSLVCAAIKNALCQLSRELPASPLTNSHREEAV